MSSKKRKGRAAGEHRQYIEVTAESLPAVPKTRQLKNGGFEIIYSQKAILGKELLKKPGINIDEWEQETQLKFDTEKVYLWTTSEPDYLDHKEAMLKAYRKQGLAGVSQYIKRIKRILSSLEKTLRTEDTI